MPRDAGWLWGQGTTEKEPLGKRKNIPAPAEALGLTSHQRAMGMGGCLVGWEVLPELGNGDFLPVLPMETFYLFCQRLKPPSEVYLS